jgi:hypothetical protein
MNIYVATSWRNGYQPDVVKRLREAGHDVYDFRNPEPGNQGSHWSQIDPNWQCWTVEEYRKALTHPVAEEGFRLDYQAMEQADVFVLVMPCGRSAHLEVGWAVGKSRPTAILLAPGEPELMYKLVDLIAVDIEDVVEWLEELKVGLHDFCRGDCCYLEESEGESELDSQCPWILASRRLGETDLLEALGHNKPDGYSSKTKAIDSCVAVELEISGVQDRADWAWVVRLKSGRFTYIRRG